MATMNGDVDGTLDQSDRLARETPRTYRVVDLHTGDGMGLYRTRAAAQRRADALDRAYGAYRYSVRSN